MAKPTAVGPQSRTVIGAVTPIPDGKPTPKKHPWKKLLIPAGIAGAVYLALKYKGHV